VARKRLGELLNEAGLLTREQLEQALAEQPASGLRLGELLLRKGWITEEQYCAVLEQQMGIPRVRLYRHTVPDDVLALVPEEFARQRKVLPLQRHAGGLLVAMADPTDNFTIDELRMRTGLPIQPAIALRDELERAIQHFYTVKSSLNRAQEEVRAAEPAPTDSDQWEGDSSAVALLVEEVLNFAVEQNASDIHFEPVEEGLRVRIRVDGVLHTARTLPLAMRAPVTARLKLVAGLNVAERRLPQDGRIRLRMESREVDFRVSTLPVIFGEKTVVRILDPQVGVRRLESLDLSPTNLRLLRRAIEAPHGLVLVTGPTGSGKSSTLYAVLSEIDTARINVVTLEDPVEYQLAGINQTQINPAIGLTFANGLRAVLRQDPDVVMVGEIRDSETAEMAVRASITGHLVFSTLHTNTAVGAVTRLVDMGVDRYLIAPALRAVMAQRLVRRVCPHCSELVPPSELEAEQLASIGRTVEALPRPRGCDYCLQTGFRGRLAIHEVIPITQRMRQIIVRGEPESALLAEARRAGSRSLLEDGLQKVAAGMTTLGEVLRQTFQDEGGDGADGD